MTRSLRWLLPFALLTLLGCNGPNGEKLGSLLGDSSERLSRELSREELAALPTLNSIDLSQPLTAADYELFGDHAQAFIVNVMGSHCPDTEPEAINTVVNRYRPNLGKIVQRLQDGEQTPEEFLRYVASLRLSAWQDVSTSAFSGDTKAEMTRFWQQNQAMWQDLGYPQGPPDLAADAVREIGITGPQAAALLEIGVKMMIKSGRVVNPAGESYAPGAMPFTGQEPDQEAFIRIGNEAWNDMMNVFTSEQRRKAFGWYRKIDRQFTTYVKQHPELAEAHAEHEAHFAPRTR